jgi:hypothetical protein
MMLVVAVGCVLGPPSIRSVKQWFWPPIKPPYNLPFEVPTEFPEDEQAPQSTPPSET